MTDKPTPLSDQAAVERGERYAEAIHDAMELDLSLVDQEPQVQALFACAAEAATGLADAERSAACICGHPEQQHFEDACLVCGCGDYLPPAAAREVIARYQEAAKQMAADRAAVLTEASRVADGIADAMGKTEESWASRANWACATVGVQLRRLAAEAQQQDEIRCSCGGRFPLHHLHADDHQPAADGSGEEAQFGMPGCTCKPWTSEGGKRRFMEPGETVDRVSGWHILATCPHHGGEEAQS